jgi:hypothetical protein
MDIGKMVNEFYTQDFPNSTELIINSDDKKMLIAAQTKYDRSSIGMRYKISCNMKTIIENHKKYYSLTFNFNKLYK